MTSDAKLTATNTLVLKYIPITAHLIGSVRLNILNLYSQLKVVLMIFLAKTIHRNLKRPMTIPTEMLRLSHGAL